MRLLLSLFFLFSIANCYSQEIELRGRYGASFIGGETIEFVGIDSFYFSGFYCTFGVHGKGRSEIRNNYLYLYFEKNQKSTGIDSLRPAKVFKSENVDSISEIDLTIVDNNGIAIPFATVEIGSANSKISTVTMADALGQVTITVENNSRPIIIKTSAVDIEPGHLELDNGSNYTITLFHRQKHLADKELGNGEIFIYEIDELSEDLILMRPQHSRERFRKYRRIKK